MFPLLLYEVKQLALDALFFPLPTSSVWHTMGELSLDLWTQTPGFDIGYSSTCTYLINHTPKINEHKAIQIKITCEGFSEQFT